MEQGQHSEVQSILRLIALLQERDLATLDDELFADEVRKSAGPYADAIIAGSAGLHGMERYIDFGLRTGPYGDRYGMQADGLNLEKVKQAVNGIDLGPLQPRIPELLRTPSGKIELAEPVLLADLARAAAALDQPAPELTLIGRRQVRSSNSWMHNLPILAKGPYRCTALLHPQDATRYGLAAGQTVELHNRHGSIQVLLELDDGMMPAW